ncbi:hypothetical protein Q5H92_00725 [Hymenobacter sp. M29]|uniref:Uncharacterized protein n=1 Tax=Hymenobacter mellowenesis TaxID=3063995 RepID=A0ABT9A5Z3_9BACT|nr:hypothetical protein [Hymenobacter sp. M29]MDO7844862.1 hypothetical protein [Hymenobacter sp. M29]
MKAPCFQEEAFMRKKRIRGFRRHLQQHQQRAAVLALPNMTRIAQDQYDTQKLGLTPWLVSDKPPLAIRKLWLGKLVADFKQWQVQLRQHYPTFYLAVWLFEPAFGESELVAAICERTPRYETAFGEALALPLPVEYQMVAGIDELQWSARKRIDIFWPEDFAELGQWASRKPHWPIESPTGEACVAVQTGLVWVGQAS